MINYFYLTFTNEELDSFRLKHIQYNIKSRLQKIDYCKYRRIDISLSDAQGHRPEIEFNDKKVANLKCYIDRSVGWAAEERKSIVILYDIIFDGINALWQKNGWDTEDLVKLLSDIKNEDYVSSAEFGKPLTSPDKMRKAVFFCELYPAYADYYLSISKKGSNVPLKINFLHGHPDPDLFFSFFPHRGWRDNEHIVVKDMNKEIFYLINVQSADVSIEFMPHSRSLEACRNYAAAFQAGVPHEQMLRWLRNPESAEGRI